MAHPEWAGRRLKVWVCTDHATFYPVGGASVVLAETKDIAERLLRDALKRHGLDGDRPFTLTPVDHWRQAIILCDGNY